MKLTKSDICIEQTDATKENKGLQVAVSEETELEV